MKKISLLIVLSLIMQTAIISQSCLPEGITFTTQAEIDNFQTNYPNCTEIEGYVEIGDWNASTTNITNLDGLNVITSIGSYLYIYMNHSLISITGLENITSIGGYLEIYENISLTSLTGLESVTSIGGWLWISENYALNSITGLSNIDGGSIMSLQISRNPSLSTCDVQPICDFLSSINGVVQIYSNDDGCNSPGEIASACGVTLSCLPFGSYYLMSQTEVDSFQIYYPGCFELEGNLWIGHFGITTNITNLDGLNMVTSIGGDFNIMDSPYLENLSGLDNMTSIGGDLHVVDNDALKSFTGFENLNSIGGDLWIFENNAIESLTGLTNLTSIYGDLWVTNADALKSLEGLDNIDPNSITGSLWINLNDSLTECDVQSICDYLAIPGGNINIYNNAPGCNSQTEVEETCEAVGIQTNNFESEFLIYPNPANDKLHITSKNGLKIETVNIYNHLGYKVLHLSEIRENIDITTLGQGIYIIELTSNDLKARQKLIIEK